MNIGAVEGSINNQPPLDSSTKTREVAEPRVAQMQVYNPPPSCPYSHYNKPYVRLWTTSRFFCPSQITSTKKP
jgi:hypothetical protein